MIKVVRYDISKKEEWDDFVRSSTVDSFLFFRDYMDYHADRFADFSIMVYDRNRLKLLLPANRSNNVLYSHQGLTFGGIIVQRATKSLDIINYFNNIDEYLIANQINEVIYKATPKIYKSQLSEADQYFLFMLGASLDSRLLSSVIDLRAPIEPNRNRKRNLQKAQINQLTISESDRYEEFWTIMNTNLQTKFGMKPVHTSDEMLLLKSRFPERIKLFTISQASKILGGMVLYLYNRVVKVQYAHASPLGKSLGAIDALYFFLIEKYGKQYDYIDFGNSNTSGGQQINEGLLAQKEGFGARGMIMDIYRYLLNGK